MPDMSEFELIAGTGEKYEITYYHPEWTGCKQGYFYLCRFVPPNSRVAIARFYEEDEARQFMGFLRLLLGGTRYA